MTNFYNYFYKLDLVIVARLVLFLDYFWFGTLKVLGTSPANALVTALQVKLFPFIDSNHFLIFFGLFECFLGICLLVPRFTRVAYPVMILHLLSTFLPLLLLTELTWQNFLTPTLTGQYILKNLVLLTLGLLVLQNSLRKAHS